MGLRLGYIGLGLGLWLVRFNLLGLGFGSQLNSYYITFTSIHCHCEACVNLHVCLPTVAAATDEAWDWGPAAEGGVRRPHGGWWGRRQVLWRRHRADPGGPHTGHTDREWGQGIHVLQGGYLTSSAFWLFKMSLVLCFKIVLFSLAKNAWNDLHVHLSKDFLHLFLCLPYEVSIVFW